MVLGTLGSGKSYFVIRHVISQHIAKGFSMFVHDFKFNDLTKITYNNWLRHKNKYAVAPKFYVINFDDLARTHRCNPLDPCSMTDITDAAESARTILLGSNGNGLKSREIFSSNPYRLFDGNYIVPAQIQRRRVLHSAPCHPAHADRL